MKSECWEWPGYRNELGYGRLSQGGKRQYVHRISYKANVGPILKGTEIHHLCCNPACYRPTHLELVTRKRHLEVEAIGWHWGGRRKYCWRGHRLVSSNILTAKGERQCRECNRQRSKDYRARNSESEGAVNA
jgi:hypothetical protein